MGKTVTTYLIDGDPKGTQYVFIRIRFARCKQILNYTYYESGYL